MEREKYIEDFKKRIGTYTETVAALKAFKHEADDSIEELNKILHAFEINDYSTNKMVSIILAWQKKYEAVMDEIDKVAQNKYSFNADAGNDDNAAKAFEDLQKELEKMQYSMEPTILRGAISQVSCDKNDIEEIFDGFGQSTELQINENTLDDVLDDFDFEIMCSKSAIKELETIIGPIKFFDKVMGRI